MIALKNNPAFLCVGLLGAVLAFGADQQWAGAQTSEQLYWKRVHEEQRRQTAEAERLRSQHRERFKASAPELIKAAAAIQPEFITAQDGFVALPPQTIPLFKRYPQQFGLGAVGLMIMVLVIRVMIRHRSEAEIRALSGGYLSDGTEVARFKMPELFAPPPPAERIPAAKSAQAPNVPNREEVRSDSSTEFYAQAPTQLEKIRAMLDELLNSLESGEGEEILWKLHGLVLDLQQKADCRKLRPAWQMSSALELFVRRVAEKPRDATPSVIRTFASAVDVLSELCVPDIRPDLITEPPLKILAVDDDALCRRAVQYALQKAHLTPDLAMDGEQAVALAANNAYDVVFMDIMMPRMDGFTACTQIHETEKNANVPVIFVTALSDFETRAQSRLKGGSDLIAKPYLVLELTVKAVTYAIRSRLQASREARSEVAVAKLGNPPGAESPVLGLIASTAAKPDSRREASSLSPSELRGDFFAEVPAYLMATRKLVEGLRGADATDLQERMDALYLRVHAIAAKAGLAGVQLAARVGGTVEALLNKLYNNPKAINTSTLNTVENALKLLESLCVRGIDQKLAGHPGVRLLVADDEPLARRAIVGALQLAFDKPESAENGASASVLAAQNTYDVIFTDVEMPLMDGFALCKDIRAGNTNRETPVVFITSHIDAASQSQAFESGANDFIGKPFLPIEITVKALTLAWEGRLRKIMKAEPREIPTNVQQRRFDLPSKGTPLELRRS